MAWGRRKSERQETFWIAAAETASGPRHVFYERLNAILAEAGLMRGSKNCANRIMPKEDGRRFRRACSFA